MRSLLVSLHDVTPAHAERVDRALALLGEFGVREYALFVVPNWHGEWPLERHSAFVERLQGLQAQGAQIVLHGLRHDEVGVERRLRDQVQTFGRTAREAEFLPLGAAEQAERIRRGLAVLRDLGLAPRGFVPPAWFHGRDTVRLVREAGLDFTEDAWAVIDARSAWRVRAPCVHWSTRKAWRAAVGVVIARVRVPLEAWRPLLRLAVHPPDIEHPGVSRSLRWVLERLLRTRAPISYPEAIAAALPSTPGASVR